MYILNGDVYEEDCRNIVFREVDYWISIEFEREEVLFRVWIFWEKVYFIEFFEVDLE